MEIRMKNVLVRVGSKLLSKNLQNEWIALGLDA